MDQVLRPDFPGSHSDDASGGFVMRDGETWYRIADYDRMAPFFMTLVSGFDHWFFLSSTGGLTCGRRDPDNALFPYTTDDKIHDADATTGPQTVLRVHGAGGVTLWRPFARLYPARIIERNLYKNRIGNRLVFEEVNAGLGLAFGYSWSTGERFGFIRKAWLRNTGEQTLGVDVLDGLRNLLPWGVSQAMQSARSTLVDAYKQAEACRDLPAAVYSLSSIPSDRAEPSEALKATVAWAAGLDRPDVLLSESQVTGFGQGPPIRGERVSRGKRGAFFVHAQLELKASAVHEWYLAADVEQGPARLPALLADLKAGIGADALEADIAAGSRRLLRLAGAADGCQRSADLLITTRHFSNTVFNIMRGGTFQDGYRFPLADFLQFADRWCRGSGGRFEALLPRADERTTRAAVLAAARAGGDADLERIALEYLPLEFSRRHGDPSRPWNRFTIDIRDADGSPRLNYEGNWRDIFQNWEALAIAYPEYVESFVCRFLNASTMDGYNPYHVSRAGFDWEVLDPGDPWSNIGYWGDHQVNYLAELIDLSRRYHPGWLEQHLARDLFVYANVPYRLKPYRDLLREPRNSIEYDHDRAARIAERFAERGVDGKLVALPDGALRRANLFEKLLVPLLAKIGNFVPGGGIWMNTQRPEWNDANNALVGYGLSVVTLCYLRRYLDLLEALLVGAGPESFAVAAEVAAFLQELHTALAEHRALLEGAVSARDRRAFMDRVGERASAYREQVYAGPAQARAAVPAADALAFIRLARAYVDHSLELSRRPDGLFHAYRLLHFSPDGCEVEDLDPMLEGQVAILNSGYLDAPAGLALLETLRASDLYRKDQDSYMLYPDRPARPFLERNVIAPDWLEGQPFLQAELDSGTSPYLLRDARGVGRFRGAFRNEGELRAALAGDGRVGAADAAELLRLYERVFRHRQFTGRSASMFKYEGLGCIYWHMVAKLTLAVSEAGIQAAGDGHDEIAAGLFERFDHLRNGLGMYKTPAQYGAFPIDPYSHTPGSGGVQQPGMTGQVKEDLIARFNELGVVVDRGEVRFEPVLLRRVEFLTEPSSWRYSDQAGERREVLPAGSLGFTLCGVPVVYHLADSASIQVHGGQESPELVRGTGLGAARSRALFERDGTIRRLEVQVPRDTLR
jgi:hypothetical protein